MRPVAMNKHIQAGVPVGNTTAIMKPDAPLPSTQRAQAAEAHWIVKRGAITSKPRMRRQR